MECNYNLGDKPCQVETTSIENRQWSSFEGGVPSFNCRFSIVISMN